MKVLYAASIAYKVKGETELNCYTAVRETLIEARSWVKGWRETANSDGDIEFMDSDIAPYRFDPELLPDVQKRFEVTVTKEIIYVKRIVVEADDEDDAEEIAIEKSEQGPWIEVDDDTNDPRMTNIVDLDE